MAKITTIVINKGEKGDPGSGGGAGVAVQPGAPASPATGALWFDTDDPAITPGEVPQHAYAEDHGVATGNADNASALNAALTTYDKVEFKTSNVTFLSGQITIPAGTTLIVPAGVTIKLKNGAETQLVLVSGRLVGDGTIDGNSANQVSTSKAPVYVVGARARVKDVTILNAPGDGVTLDPAASKAQVVNVRVDTTDGFGICAHGDDQVIERCETRNTAFAGIRTQGDAGGSNRRSRIFGNTVDQTAQPGQIGIELWAAGVDIATGATVTGNTTIGGLMGISFGHQQSATVSANTVSGFALYGIEQADNTNWCSVTANTVDGVLASGTEGISCSNTNNSNNTISGNTIRRCVVNGIHVYQGTNYTITGNIIATSTKGTSRGMTLQDASLLTVTGNQMYNVQIGIHWDNPTDGALAANQFSGVDYPLDLNWGAGSWDRIAITGNVFTSPVTILSTTNSGTLGSTITFRANPGLPDYLDYANTVIDLVGTGTPEGVVTAGIGSLFRRRDGTTGTTLYKKQTGTGNTGWVAS